MFLFFFFQAEDGIRDSSVTGVQTCALPILSFLPLSHSYEHTAGLMFPISIGAEIYFAEGADTLATNLVEVQPTIMTAVPRIYERSEERRVGKECRSRWSPYH